MSGISKKLKRKPVKSERNAEGQESKLTLDDHPETNEYEIKKQSDDGRTIKKIRFPKQYQDQLKLPPEEFKEVQDAVEAYKREQREVEIYGDSIESVVGYGSFLRVLSKHYAKQVAYYRSADGGSLPLEEARKAVYREKINDEQAVSLIRDVIRLPSDFLTFTDLLEINNYSPTTAENIWEMIKREAQAEFESGHRAAEAFEPADYMRDAWNRASYLGLRESLCEEWQPKGGIELTMIDAIAQAWLQLQFWTRESVKRAETEPRREDYDFVEWKLRKREADRQQWQHGYWDIPFVSEQDAIDQAAQMADRWQRKYFRAIRNLRDWRRYTPQVTINNPQQVNIAADGGQQVNVAEVKENNTQEIRS